MTVRDALDRGQFVVTTEVQVPSDDATDEVIARLRRIQGRVSGVSVTATPAPGRPIEAVVADSLQICHALRESSLQPVFRLATRASDRPRLQERLLRASECGVHELLVFTEDYRLTGDGLEEMMFFHVDTGKLFSVVDSLRRGRKIQGEELPEPVRFCIGSGVDCSRGGKMPPLQREELEHVAEQGVDYLLTTPVFDLDAFRGFMERVKPLGLPVIAEVMTIPNATLAHYLNRYVRPGLVPPQLVDRLASSKDKERTRLEVFADLVSGVRELCQGVHVVPIGVGRGLHRYLDAAGIV